MGKLSGRAKMGICQAPTSEREGGAEAIARGLPGPTAERRGREVEGEVVRDVERGELGIHVGINDGKQINADETEGREVTPTAETVFPVLEDGLETLPMANIMLEWRQYDKAELYLIRCILTCAKHLEIRAFARRQVELLGHLLQVYFLAGEYSKCQAVIDKLDEKVEKIGVLIEDI